MRVSLLSAHFFLVFILSSASAATIHVPGQHPTIQAGIDCADPGDTVLVAPGVYTGPGNKGLDFSKDIVLLSEEGPETTIIDCEQDGRGVVVHSWVTRDAVLRGFTIRNGVAASGAGIRIVSSTPTIENCIISSNTATGNGGAGIDCRDTNTGPMIAGCSIVGNSAPAGQGGGIRILSDEPDLMIVDCFIAGNNAVSGGGVYCSFNSPTGPMPTLSGCAVTGNYALHNGGGVACIESSPTIVGCTVSGNLAGNDGGGLWCFDNSSPNLEQTILRDNCASGLGDQAYFYPFSNPAPTVFTCCGLDPFGMEPIELAELIGEQVFADPAFCLPLPCEAAPTSEGDYRLSAGSPCLPENSPCGELIGAFGEGCLAPSSAPEAGVRWLQDQVTLAAPTPNPTSRLVTGRMAIPRAARVTLRVFDVRGRLVSTLVDRDLPSGIHDFSWNPIHGRGSLGSGVYHLSLEALGVRRTQKVVVAW